MRTSTAALVALVALAGLVPPGAARAASKVIPMDRFRQGCEEPASFMQNPAVVSVPPSVNDTWCGYARVRLPVGSVIEGVTYYRWADSGSSTGAYLDRTRPPRGPENLGAVFNFATTADHHYYPVQISMSTTADLVVRPGYIYYVTLHIFKGAGVSGVKVLYQPAGE